MESVACNPLTSISLIRIDVEELGEDVNIVIQVEGAEELEGDIIEDDDDEDFLDEPNEWYFDDDPYNVVYYEFPDEDDEE